MEGLLEVGGNFSYRIADEDYTDYASFKQAVQLNPTFSVDEMDAFKGNSYSFNPVKNLTEQENGAKQELLPEFKDEEDQDFARRLFRRTILNADYYRHLISENTKNWDLDRVAFMDVVIMQIALAEILSFPNIPVSVSLNEYVEIAKLYSTPKSGGFINGTLDGIVNSLKKENKLTKN